MRCFIFMYICKCSLMPFMYVLIVKILSYVKEIKNIYLSTLIRLHQMEFPALINEDKSILNVRVVRYILSISFKKSTFCEQTLQNRIRCHVLPDQVLRCLPIKWNARRYNMGFLVVKFQLVLC